MSRPPSRLDEERDAEAEHDLVEVREWLRPDPVASARKGFAGQCACGWGGETVFTAAAARRAHEKHRDHALGLPAVQASFDGRRS